MICVSSMGNCVLVYWFLYVCEQSDRVDGDESSVERWRWKEVTALPSEAGTAFSAAAFFRRQVSQVMICGDDLFASLEDVGGKEKSNCAGRVTSRWWRRSFGRERSGAQV